MALTTACTDFPRDAEHTTDRIRALGVLRAGLAPAEPWATDPPGGIEPELVEAFAETLGARVEWTVATESELVAALEERALDLAVAGFTTDAPWKDRVGFTQPYVKVHLAVGIDGVERPRPWDGTEVVYDPDRLEVAAAVRRIEADPVPGDALSAPIAAAYEEELLAAGYRVEERLRRESHVMALPPGENALAFALDHFLQDREEHVLARLRGER